MAEPSFWDDQEKAQGVIASSKSLKNWTDPALQLEGQLKDLQAILTDAIELNDAALLDEIRAQMDQMGRELGELELRSMLSGEMDGLNCFLSINAGAGGTESCDWVAMLARMYQRWAAHRGWQVEEIDAVPGEVAGLKSITLKITGPFAYGYAKAERGVHRLVRISPYDSNARRHTSFASVDLTPEIADDIQVEIRPEDLRIDTYRASGAGGQHVNRTDSAVRITHGPSGIVVSSQSERSQLQNKETCFRMLRSKLYERQLEERESQLRQLSGEKKEIGWGSQIRSYVFQPYTLVKDNRTKVEIGNVQAVMDGEIDPFIEAYLKEFGERPREAQRG
jgi:peptide chain release factor 2